MLHKVDENKNKVILGLSGGVDSTTAALLLSDKNFDVYGLYFDVKGENEEGRMAAESVLKQVYSQKNKEYNNDKFIYINACKRFKDIVISNFCNEYLSGRTPNPCIICNPNIKFKYLIDEADNKGAYYIATGHYASTVYSEELHSWFIKSVDNKKDQSYMLYRLPQNVIARLILPLADIDRKEAVRQLARDNNLINADLKDSQEICFIDDTENYVDYIKDAAQNAHQSDGLQNKIIVDDNLCNIKKGDFIDKAGNVIGEHNGIINYTVGQRKGLGITFGKPVYVTALNPTENTVTLGESEDLFQTSVKISDCFFTETGCGDLPKRLEKADVMAKIRYAAKPISATVFPSEKETITIKFKTPVRAATPGQSLVLYQEGLVVGGGFIL